MLFFFFNREIYLFSVFAPFLLACTTQTHVHTHTHLLAHTPVDCSGSLLVREREQFLLFAHLYNFYSFFSQQTCDICTVGKKNKQILISQAIDRMPEVYICRELSRVPFSALHLLLLPEC